VHSTKKHLLNRPIKQCEVALRSFSAVGHAARMSDRKSDGKMSMKIWAKQEIWG